MTGDVRRAYLIDEILVDGRPLVRIREVVPGGTHRTRPLRDVRYAGVPATGKKGVRRRVLVGLVAAVLGVLAVLGWALYLIVAWVIAHALTVGALVALAVLLAGGGGGCTVVVTHVRR